MITQIIQLLQSNEFYGFSEEIEIAKGKYQLVTTWKQGFEQIKRQWKTR